MTSSKDRRDLFLSVCHSLEIHFFFFMVNASVTGISPTDPFFT